MDRARTLLVPCPENISSEVVGNLNAELVLNANSVADALYDVSDFIKLAHSVPFTIGSTEASFERSELNW